MTFADGTTRDVSALAAWSTDYGTIVSIAGGRVTARSYGQCKVTVFYTSVSATVGIRVLPEGMYMVSGRISDESGMPLRFAKVTVTPTLVGMSTSTDQNGLYSVPAGGEVEVRAELDGFAPQVQRLTVAADSTLDFKLSISAGAFGGVYRLDLFASPSCTLRQEALKRSYLVRLTERPSGSISAVVISPEMVAWGESGFTGRRDGTRVRFFFTDDPMDYTFVELLESGAELALVGSAVGEIGDSIRATFSGTVTVRSRIGITLEQCDAEDHRLEFTR